jgi:hypothetical protein
MERDTDRLPRGAAPPGRSGPASRSASGPARGRPPQAPARRARGGDRLLPPHPDREPPRPAGARLPARPRLHRRHHLAPPAGLRRRRLGHAQPVAGREARLQREELEAAGLVSRRQGRRGVYDRFRGRIIFPIRDARATHRALGGRIIGAASSRTRAHATRAPSTSTRRPRRCSTRAARCTSSTAPRAPSARPAWPCWSRATRTR